MRSPLHDFNARHGARFVDFGGWEMPVQYESVLTEHRAVRESVGVFDVSHLGRFSLEGPGALSAIDRLLCNDITKIYAGRTQYTMMLNGDGGIVDDLIVWWWGEEEFWILPNAANHGRVMGAFSSQSGCEVEDMREDSVLIAVQGPHAPEVLESVLGQSPKRFHTAGVNYEGAVVSMAGTGYTGERGGELCTDPATGERLMAELVGAGATLCGLGARDTLRLEAGLALWGEDIDESTSPIEAGLGFVVGIDHDFVGRQPILRQMEEGTDRRLTGFKLSGKGIPRRGHTIRAGGSSGSVTSGNLSPMLNTGIGMGYLSPPVETGVPMEVEIRGRWVAGEVAEPPFHTS